MLTRALRATAALTIMTALAACGGPDAASSAAAAVVRLTAPPEAATPGAATEPSAAALAIPAADQAGSAITGASSADAESRFRVGPPPLRPVPAGQRPPQIVVTAFDDSGDAITSPEGHYAIFDYWRRISREYDARMTFFLTGLQLLTSRTEHTYDAPQLGPGNSQMGFAFDHVQPLPGETQTDAVRHEMNNLKGAYAEGNEIGTHFGGHICGRSKGSVGSFSSADWEQEITQFNQMVDNANQTNQLNPPVNLGFTSADIVGSRTPCLEGNFRALYPVLEKHGYTYDTSPTPQSRWPRRGAPGTGPTNLWVFPLATLQMYGSKAYALSMDWNICAWHDSGCEPKQVPAAAADQWSQTTLDTWRNYFETSYTGDRAPLFIGYHPEMWHHGAYTKALAGFLKETCRKPEVRCVSYREVADWMNKVPAEQLDSWRNAAFPHYTDPNPPAYGTGVADVDMPRPIPDAAGPPLDRGTGGDTPPQHTTHAEPTTQPAGTPPPTRTTRPERTTAPEHSAAPERTMTPSPNAQPAVGTRPGHAAPATQPEPATPIHRPRHTAAPESTAGSEPTAAPTRTARPQRTESTAGTPQQPDQSSAPHRTAAPDPDGQRAGQIGRSG